MEKTTNKDTKKRMNGQAYLVDSRIKANKLEILFGFPTSSGKSFSFVTDYTKTIEAVFRGLKLQQSCNNTIDQFVLKEAIDSFEDQPVFLFVQKKGFSTPYVKFLHYGAVSIKTDDITEELPYDASMYSWEPIKQEKKLDTDIATRYLKTTRIAPLLEKLIGDSRVGYTNLSDFLRSHSSNQDILPMLQAITGCETVYCPKLMLISIFPHLVKEIETHSNNEEESEEISEVSRIFGSI